MNQKPLSQTRAMIELILAGMLWGFGFIAAVWALGAAGPWAITGWRFMIAGLTGLVLARGFARSPAARTYLKAAWIPGAMIAATIVFQTWGLQYTTATKSGFITCLYVLMVPMMEPLFGGRRPTLKIYACSLCALAGVAMMCGLFAGGGELDDRSRLNIGDLLTLICAVAASTHILVIGRVDKKLGTSFNGFHFNTAQSFAAGLPTLAVAMMIEPGALAMPMRLVQTSLSDSNHLPLIGFLSLTFCSTLIGFALQVRAQRVLTPSTASVLFLLESPFAAFFALVFLGEKLGMPQLLGGALILVAVGYSSYSALKKPPHTI